jgi:hypothetical protein
MHELSHRGRGVSNWKEYAQFGNQCSSVRKRERLFGNGQGGGSCCLETAVRTRRWSASGDFEMQDSHGVVSDDEEFQKQIRVFAMDSL